MPLYGWWAGRESNPHSRKTADLQSAELTTCSTYPLAAAVATLPVGRPRGASGAALFSWILCGAADGTRTRNRRFTKPLLYQLSYGGATTKDTAKRQLTEAGGSPLGGNHTRPGRA